VRKVLIVFGVTAVLLVGIWFGVGAALPADYEVSRAIEIAAPAEKVYQLVGHLDRWPEWTAWNVEKYPDIVYSYPGTREGTGAVQTWTMDAGVGRLEITAAEASRGISYDLTFDGGEFASVGIISFATDAAKPGITSVTWSDRGKLESTTKRWFGLLLDRMMGPQFEEGLATLKKKVEAG
jgi:uncharacterized membrane protein